MRPHLVAAPLLALALAAPAHAAWTVRTLPTGEETFLGAVGARSDGRPQLVDARRHAGAWRLELRSGGTYRRLDESSHQAGDVHVGHDDRNGVVVAWDRATGGARGARQAFVWTTHGGTRQLTHGAHSVSVFGMDVASDGTAVLGLYTAGTVQVVRHGARTDAFGAPETLSAPGARPGFPAVGAAPEGRAVVAWSERDVLVARAAGHPATLTAPAGGATFGPPRVVTPPADPGGAALAVDDPTVAMSATGRAFVAFQTSPHVGGTVSGHRVDAFAWDADAAAPGPARTLSLAPWAGAPQLLARGGVGYFAWKETGAKHRPAHVLRSVRWAGPEPGPVTTYRPAPDAGTYTRRLVLAPLPGTAVQAYWQPSAGGRFQTVALDGAGRPRGAATITGPEGAVYDAAAALTGAGPLLAWTRPRAPYRVMTAHP